MVFPIGLPILYLWILYQRRHQLDQEKQFSFFVHDYVPSMWFWEIVECFKRLCLVGGAVFLERGSLMQIGFSINVVMLYLIALLVLRPYRQHNLFTTCINTLLFTTLFAGLFIKLKAGFTSKGIYSDGISIEFLTVVLIASAGGVIVTFFGVICFSSPSGSHSCFDKLCFCFTCVIFHTRAYMCMCVCVRVRVRMRVRVYVCVFTRAC
jgi:hypothetical protein